jgi:transmembrane sensor
VEWVLRQQQPGFSESDRQALTEWLLLSPLHVDEFLAVSMVWGTLGWAGSDGYGRESLIEAARAELATQNVVPLRATTEVFGVPAGTAGVASRLQRLWQTAAAIIIVLGAGLFGAYFSFRSPVYATARGEQRSLVLADGSVVTLNTDSRVRVRLQERERDIDLLLGEARFQVAKDSTRPFIVKASGAEVRALGTVFDVRVDGDRTQVAVIEGHVAVKATAARGYQQDAKGSGPRLGVRPAVRQAVLHAGDRAVVGPGSVVTGDGQSVETVNAWTERKLVFRNATLQTVIDEFNRYRVHPLKLDDAELGALRISGVFAVEDPESLLAYLRGFETVATRRDADGSDHLIRARPH